MIFFWKKPGKRRQLIDNQKTKHKIEFLNIWYDICNILMFFS